MTSTHPRTLSLACVMMLILFTGIILFGTAPPVQAAPGGDRQRGSQGREVRTAPSSQRGERQREFRTGDMRTAPSNRHGSSHREFRDTRYQLDRSYPIRGQYRATLPRDHRVVVHGGSRYFFSGGAWYRPFGARFLVTIPPIGLVIPFLPPYYATVWVGGVPYYYANDVYYANRGDGYIVVEPPKEDVSQAPPPAERMFVYPRLGQSEQQQAEDRDACHRWAVDQTGFDPTQTVGGMSDAPKIEKSADYQRAMSACLDGRGYTVK